MLKATINLLVDGNREERMSLRASLMRSEERRRHQYHAFYHKVIELLGDSDNVALFGPGEAKIELAKEIEKVAALQRKEVAVEACDRVTENQFVAKVKTFFASKK